MGPGSVSLRLYPHLELGVEDIVVELLAQGRLADDAGFDGVMTSEHHNAFAGYLPNPLQAAGWLLDTLPRAWAAACPLLLPLRPAALVAEEVAWLAARFPGRVGLGVAAGSLPTDFAVMGVSQEALAARFADGLALLAGLLLGRQTEPLDHDPAVLRCAASPVPLVSAAVSVAAARRAAALGVGLVLDSLASVERCRRLVDAYTADHGPGPVVLIRRAWVGDAPAALQAQQLGRYRSYASSDSMRHWGSNQIARPDPGSVADELVRQAESAGADALNLRVHVPGLEPLAVRRQIEALGAALTKVRERWSGSGPAAQRA